MALQVDAFLPPTLLRRLSGPVFLHRGSQGILVKATEVGLGREVVVKLVETSSGRKLGDTLEEARLHSRLGGLAGVCPLLAAGGVDDQWVFLMLPFYRRGSLSDLLAEGPVAPDVAAAIGAELAATLAQVHERGIAHGDIKPSNVLVSDDGALLLADFGCASLADADSTLSDNTGLLATLSYLAPELLAGDPPSPSSDVYSLGLTVAAMMSGRSPQRRDGETPIAFLERLSSGDEPDLGDIAMPEALARSIESMCAPSPRRRPSAAQVAADLSAQAGGRRLAGSLGALSASEESSSPPGTPARRPRRSRGPTQRQRRRSARVGALVVASLAAGGAFGFSIADGGSDREALSFCRAYGELSNSSAELVRGVQTQLTDAPTMESAIDAMLNDAPRRFAAEYQRFASRRADFPEMVRGDLIAAAPFVARIELADYLARLDGRAVFDEKRRARMDLLPEVLRAPTQAYVAVDQMARSTCGLPDSAFPVLKGELMVAVSKAFVDGGPTFFADQSNAQLVPADAAEVIVDVAPDFMANLSQASPQFLLALYDGKPDVASAMVARHPSFLVDLLERGAEQGVRPARQAWVDELRRTLVDPAEIDRLIAAAR